MEYFIIFCTIVCCISVVVNISILRAYKGLKELIYSDTLYSMGDYNDLRS